MVGLSHSVIWRSIHIPSFRGAKRREILLFSRHRERFLPPVPSGRNDGRGWMVAMPERDDRKGDGAASMPERGAHIPSIGGVPISRHFEERSDEKSCFSTVIVKDFSLRFPPVEMTEQDGRNAGTEYPYPVISRSEATRNLVLQPSS